MAFVVVCLLPQRTHYYCPGSRVSISGKRRYYRCWGFWDSYCYLYDGYCGHLLGIIRIKCELRKYSDNYHISGVLIT